MEHPARVEEEREGGTGPQGRDRGGERPPGVAAWVAEGIIRVVLGVADSPCGCLVGIWLSGLVLERGLEHPARVEEEREGGTGPRGRDRGGERPNFYPDFIGERRTLMQLGEILTLTLSLP